ncbi:hypothetical protein FVE85_8838 [Porphyridium purpureum]|uniref:Uncharacterized protein n=1 Tax=Porphyridium purpureum TaxID=35688 RepID=A0A5J4YRI1_PORPP|nr:hypothetical protein FVE85_8838 [Porphyridium purpureum]|eukprot:POR4837..scf296_7
MQYTSSKLTCCVSACKWTSRFALESVRRKALVVVERLTSVAVVRGQQKRACAQQTPRGVPKRQTLRCLRRCKLPAVKVVVWFKALENHKQREDGERARIFHILEGRFDYPVPSAVTAVDFGESALAGDPTDLESFVTCERVKHELMKY